MSQPEATDSVQYDLFSLAGESFDEQLAVFKTLPEHGPHEHVPDHAEQLAGLILANAVGLIRQGSRHEILSAATELSSMAIIPQEERHGAHANEEAARLLEAASVVLGAAGNIGSRGLEYNLLQKHDGEWPLATRMLSTLVTLAKDEEGDGYHWIARPELEQALERLGEEYSHNVEVDLNLQGLIREVPDTDEDVWLLMPYGDKIEQPHVRQLLDAYEREQGLTSSGV
jgi:hypothetical protein